MLKSQDFRLNLEQIKNVLQANVISGADRIATDIYGIYASDLMSDVLAYGKSGSVMLTGLCTNQAVVSAYMADFRAIVFLRGKTPDDVTRKFAEDKDLIIMSTKADMFEACVKIANIYTQMLPNEEFFVSAEDTDKYISTHEFTINGSDFASSGLVSSQIKSTLKNIGYDPQLIRRVAIATYEAEMNVFLHAIRANVTLSAGEGNIIVVIDDEGKGIPDIEKAMQEGYTTATDDQRALGFGAGMGLPNMKKNTDNFDIATKVGKGTKITMEFLVS